jgi:HAD domain in Swiss Army Knife RNA repair proteins
MDPPKPLLLVDIDGVISLFGFDPSEPPAGRFELVDGSAHYLSATAGEHLRELSQDFELVWCSGWEEKANEYLPLALGLPDPLPHLTFDGTAKGPAAHWKLAAIDAYAGRSRALAWIDDAHDEHCLSWAAARGGPTLLVTTEPALGLTDEHVAQLLAWAREQSLGGRVRPGVG